MAQAVWIEILKQKNDIFWANFLRHIVDEYINFRRILMKKLLKCEVSVVRTARLQEDVWESRQANWEKVIKSNYHHNQSVLQQIDTCNYSPLYHIFSNI